MALTLDNPADPRLQPLAHSAAVFARELNALESHDQITVICNIINQAITRDVPRKGRRMNARAAMLLMTFLGETLRKFSTVDQIGPLARCVVHEAKTLIAAAQAAEAREAERKASRKRRRVVVSFDARRTARAPATTATAVVASALAAVHAHPAFIGLPPMGGPKRSA